MGELSFSYGDRTKLRLGPARKKRPQFSQRFTERRKTTSPHQSSKQQTGAASVCGLIELWARPDMPNALPITVMCRVFFLSSSGRSSGCQCHSDLRPVFLASQNARRGEQNAYLPDLAGVAELADALDSKSSGRKAVWVRAPPPADRPFS